MVQKVALKPQNYVPQLPIITAPSREFIIRRLKLYNLAEVRNVSHFDGSFFERFKTRFFFFISKPAQVRDNGFFFQKTGSLF